MLSTLRTLVSASRLASRNVCRFKSSENIRGSVIGVDLGTTNSCVVEGEQVKVEKPGGKTYDDSLLFEAPVFSPSNFREVISDVNLKMMVQLGRDFNIEHLAPTSFGGQPFPVTGVVFGNKRLLVPLTIGTVRKHGPVINCWFLVDTGSPSNIISKTTMMRLYNDYDRNRTIISIQAPELNTTCQLVDNDNTQEINILGMDALLDLKISIVIENNITFHLMR